MPRKEPAFGVAADDPLTISTLLAELATIVRNTCRTPQAPSEAPTFELMTTPNEKHKRALTLLEQIRL